MAEQIDDGGAAFPGMVCVGRTAGNEPIYEHPHGMSLRDWFAGQALAGMLASLYGKKVPPFPTEQYLMVGYANEVSSNAYAFADAMLKARQ